MEKVKLGEVCTVVSGSTPKTSIKEYWDGDVKWITPAEIDENSFYVYDTVRHITEEGKNKTGLSYLPEGTVMLSSRAPIGKTAIAGCEMCCNQGFKNLICSDRIHNEYLFYFLSCKTDYLNSLGRGATFKEISKSIVESISIPLPEIEEQKQIAEIFLKLDVIKKRKKAQLEKIDELVKARFVELFGDPVENPYGWKQTILKNIAIGKLSYGSGASACEYDENIRYVRITDIDNSGRLNNDVVSPSVIDEKYILNDGDILFARSGATVGKSYRYRESDGKCLYAGYLIRLVPNTELVLPDYVFYYTKTSYYERFIASNMKVVAQPNINAQQYGDLTICIPPMELQKDFLSFVEQTDKSKLEVQKTLEKLELLKKALMQKYFG
ncbi:MAG: restriction endonuclease subunit S [Clostridia bacterium]|nr:restriction endonuclease subunit S [Clostridia bacterium]